MKTNTLKTVKRFTWIVILTAMIISLLGIFFNDFYRDNPFIKSIWRGNDVITLLITIPLILFSMHKTRENPLKFNNYFILWLGGLWYMIYNYFFYIYGAAFNVFFLGYIIIIIGSIFGLINGLIAFGSHIDQIVTESVIKRSFAGYSRFLLLFGIVLGSMWTLLASSFLFTGEVPTAITQTGHPTGVVFATDLIFLVTPLIALSYYLSKNNKWAILLTPIILVKCCLYPFVFIVSGIFAYIETQTYDVLTPIYLLLGLGAAIVMSKMIKRLQIGTVTG